LYSSPNIASFRWIGRLAPVYEITFSLNALKGKKHSRTSDWIYTCLENLL